jgi:quercetin dioxygenase-like cupin family protein
MQITTIADAPVAHRSADFEGRRLAEGPAAVVVHMTLAPGGAVPPHPSPVDIAFFIIEGRAEISVGDETEAVEAGSLAASPRGLPHGLFNPGPGICRVLVIKGLA